MPFDSQGNFTRLHNWEQDRIDDIDIVTDHHDEEDNNFADGLSNCMLRDGRCTMSGNLDMGNFQIKKVGDGTLSTDAVNKSQLDETKDNIVSDLTTLLNKLWKIGDIKASVKTSNHDNWFLCNGQAISRVTYSDLFSLISTKFGAGDGTTTFNLPDYRGKFLRGLGGNSARDIYTTQAEGLPNITGGLKVNTQWINPVADGAFTVNSKTTTTCPKDAGSAEGANYYNFNASDSNSIYGASSHVTPINQAVNYFIKVKEEE